MRDIMKKRGRLSAILLIISILSCVVLPVANAETLDIGTKTADSDFKWYTFSSGIVVSTGADYIDYAPLIFDGNESTGLDHDFGADHNHMSFTLGFPHLYYITNITLKPHFGGNVSKYSLSLYYLGQSREMVTGSNIQSTLHINRTLEGIGLKLDSNGTNHFYFNDMIINYTPSVYNHDELQNQINNLNNSVLQLESENAALKEEIQNLTTEIEILKSTEKQPDNNLVYTAIILGILGIILALAALISISKKFGSQEPSTAKEESEDIIPKEK
ncbi:MAG: hypothetical protein JSW00_14300 [Thermoplasmata archaeon]|nr:MAG: hypothetical protein JSW00_14300 [Thermoplasmata archaeon]